MARSSGKRTYDSPLRAERAQNTRRRIIDALARLIENHDLQEVSARAVAREAGISQPTVFHYFPTKGDLFTALASRQFRQVVDGLDPRSPDELADAFHSVYRRAEAIEPLVRWTLANPIASSTPRPHRGDRMLLLQTALQEVLRELSAEDATRLECIALLLSSPMASLYWKDYLGLSADDSADVAGWALRLIITGLSPNRRP